MYFIAFLGFLHLFLNPFLKSYFLEPVVPVHRVRVCVLLELGAWKLFTLKADVQSFFRTAFPYLAPRWTPVLLAAWTLRVLNEPV